MIQTTCACVGRTPQVVQLVAQFGEVLLFLKEKGALLNTVTPESLLSREDYLAYKVKRPSTRHPTAS